MGEPPVQLRRSLSLVDVFALGINGVIGTGIFMLPGMAAEPLGPAAVLTLILSAVLCTLLVLCFAEVSVGFPDTGGPMLYSRAAFGDLVGFEVGWITWLVRVTTWAALANGLVTATEALVPGAGAYRVALLVIPIAMLTLLNIGGISMGALAANLFTVSKLLPILVFISVGLFFVDLDLLTPFAPHGYRELPSTTLMILYAFVGFEVLTVPAGEMRDPKRSVPIALISVIGFTTVVYLLMWLVCAGTLPTLAGSANPVAEAAGVFMGPVGAKFVALGIFFSVLGINAAVALVAPRCLFALAEEGFLPRWFGYIHPRTRTPIVSILVSSAVTLVLALSGSYVEMAVISVIARFAQYIPTCLALPILRRKRPVSGGFRVPWGPTIPLSAVALCVWLLIQSEPHRLFWGTLALLSGLIFYLPWRIMRAGSTT